jgi:diaminohydroxyphosphoribosylaminopyrimidine deaminase / 5-amino-6-(5-phosphoribosylamino)uracil reductase
MKEHKKYMKRCLQLAKNGLSTAIPNPSVGAVIVFENKIIGEGYTSKYGGNHAEVNAINSVKNKSLLSKSTIYVSLEPCSHFGKTPPCANLIVEHKIPRVVIGCVDSFSEVSGKGIEKLKQAGCEVILGILEEECLQSNVRFFTFHNKKRPYVILKWAETADGFVAPLINKSGKSVAISNNYSRQKSHQLRANEKAILVGVNTVLQDNPNLDTRDWFGNHPIRIVLDKENVIENQLNVKNQSQETIIFTENPEKSTENLEYIKIDFDKNLVENILNKLYQKNIQSIIIEGGTKTLQQFIDTNIWDEAYVYKSDKRLENGIKAPCFTNGNVVQKTINIKNDVLTILKPN